VGGGVRNGREEKESEGGRGGVKGEERMEEGCSCEKGRGKGGEAGRRGGGARVIRKREGGRVKGGGMV